MSVDPASEPRQTPSPKAPASGFRAPAVCSSEEWAEFKARDPQGLQRIHGTLRQLSGERAGWASVLGVEDADLLAMSRAAAASMDQGRFEEASQTFRALTLLDPLVPWFWLSLGESRLRESKIAEAIDAF